MEPKNETPDGPGNAKPERRWYHDLFGLTPLEPSVVPKSKVDSPPATKAGNSDSPLSPTNPATTAPKSNEPGQPTAPRPYLFEPPPDQPLNPHMFSPRAQMLMAKRAPRVLITPEAYKRMQLYVELARKEVGWLGTVTRQENGDFLIDQTYLLEQEVTPTETELSVEGQNKLVNELLANPNGDEGLDQVNRLRFWGHSHVRMQTSPSGTDERTMERWQSEGLPWAVRGIFNKLGRAEFTVYLYEEGYRICDAPWVVFDPAKGKVVLAQPERRSDYSAGHGGFSGRPSYERTPWLGQSTAHNDILGGASAGGPPRSFGPTLRVPADLKADDALRNEVTLEFTQKVSERLLGVGRGWFGFGSGSRPAGAGRDEEWAQNYHSEGAVNEPSGDGAPAEVTGRPASSSPREQRSYPHRPYGGAPEPEETWSLWNWLFGPGPADNYRGKTRRWTDTTGDAPDRSDKQ